MQNFKVNSKYRYKSKIFENDEGKIFFKGDNYDHISSYIVGINNKYEDYLNTKINKEDKCGKDICGKEIKLTECGNLFLCGKSSKHNILIKMRKYDTYIEYIDYNNRPERIASSRNRSYPQKKEYGYSSYKRVCSQEERVKCLLSTWGPDVCSLAFEEFAEKKLDSESYDTITSPLCGKMISESLHQEFTKNDIAVGATTGLLDDLGTKSWQAGGFWGVMGAGVAKFTSFAIKTGVYSSCLEKCENRK